MKHNINNEMVENNHHTKKNNRKLEPMKPFTLRLRASTLSDLRKIRQDIREEQGAKVGVAQLLNLSADILVDMSMNEIVEKLSNSRQI